MTFFSSLELRLIQAWLIGSLAISILWVVYITFYNSRVVGYFITKFINRMFMKGSYFKIGKQDTEL